MNQLITGEAKLSSREIASLTKKEHKNVIRDIRNMYESLRIDGIRSEPSDYIDSRGKSQPEYILDSEHTMILVTGYSIPLRAAVIKRLKELESGAIAVMSDDPIIAMRQKQIAIENRVSSIEEDLNSIIPSPGFYTVLAYARNRGARIDNPTASRIGRSASAICRDKGIMVGSVPDSRYGSINAYPEEILKEAFEGENNA